MKPGTTTAGDEAGRASGLERATFAMAIAFTGALAVGHAARIATATSAATWPEVAVALLAGVLVADFVTGLVHWACDTWGDERAHWPGAGLIRSFREHHRRPTGMLEHDWIEVNGEAAAAAVAPLALMALPGFATVLLAHPAWYAFAWSAIGMAALSNQIHQWAHMHGPPRLVRRLQRAGLILSRRRHALHHRAPCVERYCITTGWLNPVLDRLAFWRALERGLTRATGAVPRAGDTRPHAAPAAVRGPARRSD